LAAQQKEALYTAGLAQMDNVIRLQRARDSSSRIAALDRRRTEQERAELLTQLSLVRAEWEVERGRMLAYLPPEVDVTKVLGQIEAPPVDLDPEHLAQAALSLRQDYRAQRQKVEQYQFERRAADRLKVPEPIVSAGFKRADVGAGRIIRGNVLGISVPLPLFDRGKPELDRVSAEQERAHARMQALAQGIRASVRSTVEALRVRLKARDEYRRQLEGLDAEHLRVSRVAGGPVAYG
jgi:outer membrane protein TolC